MPITTEDVVASIGRVKTNIFIPVEKSVLSALSVIDLSNAITPNDTWVELGIMSGGTNPEHKVATLAAGYTGKDSPVSWTGKIITEPEMSVYAHIYSTTGGSFRLVGLVTPYKVTPEGALILDP